MTTFLVILGVIFFVFYLIGNSNNNNSKTERTSIRTANKNKVSSTELNREKIPTVSELVKEVETIAEFAAFEKKQEEVFNKFRGDFDNKFYERLYNRYDNAFAKISEKISDKAFYYQYLPNLDLNTPMKNLSIAYSHFNVDEYKLKKKGTSTDDWQEITGNDLMSGGNIEEVILKKPDYFQALVQFREVIESKLKLQEKYEKIIDIVKNNESLKKEFFDEDEISPEKQCLIWLLRSFKIPLLDKLIEFGFDTPEKIKAISKQQLKTIRGFGPSKIELFYLTINEMKKL